MDRNRVWTTDIKLHLFVYIWLIVVKTAKEATTEVVDYFGMGRTIHKGFSICIIYIFDRLAGEVISRSED